MNRGIENEFLVTATCIPIERKAIDSRTLNETSPFICVLGYFIRRIPWFSLLRNIAGYAQL